MKDNINNKIDFVITWVDGNDKNWLKEKNEFLNIKGDSNVNRFRDFDNLQYLFRGIDKYAPWVNKVFFITWGHLPTWLNTNNPKLRIVNHKEFIPEEYLPTFNSNVIEMNLHRIQDLSENFVLFNDDLFILNKLEEKDFFVNNLPRDYYVEYVKKNPSKRHQIMRKNYYEVIDNHFEKKNVLKANINKILNLKYGKYLFNNIFSLKDREFNDFLDLHATQTFNKSTFNEAWKIEPNKLNEACKNRFRANNDMGKNICRYIHLLKGRFSPYILKSKYFEISNDNSYLIKHINGRMSKIICINDVRVDIDFETCKTEINGALNSILPEKSNFEK